MQRPLHRYLFFYYLVNPGGRVPPLPPNPGGRLPPIPGGPNDGGRNGNGGRGGRGLYIGGGGGVP
ncbi:MAG: hypothetical protein IJ513_03520 [Bacteroidaceae bacterium]|nr:hypothetical protein [Bacteroidaceae bacterium]